MEFPLLNTMLPSANGGLYPAEKAEKTLEELDRFLSKISEVKCWTLCTSETNETIWTSTRHSEFTWMLGPYDRVSMAGDKVLFHHAGRAPVATSHFKQVPIGSPDSSGFQRMMIVCLDSNERTVTFGSIGPTGSPPIEREFIVIPQYAPFLHHGKYWTAERIRNLLIASIETSNPIRWC